jgi:hypothetical protein
MVGRALREEPLLVVHGAVGCGKTRLARELSRRPEVIGTHRVAYIPCRTGDRSIAIRARAERALDVLPGSLADTLRNEERLLIIDDIHHLPEDDVSRLLGDLVSDESRGRVLVLTRDVLPLRRDRGRFEMTLDGLDEAAARELWTHHEETYGPTPATACDQAILRTRGMPLALRREYARAAFGATAWKIEKLPKNVRRALEAVAVIRIPAAPAAVAALVPEVKKPEPALIELVSRQLIDPLDDGRFSIHDVVRDDVLESMDEEARQALERAAASLVSTIGRGRSNARRMAWDAGDDGALGMVDPVDRMREAVLHLLAAKDVDAAAARLVEDRNIATRRGGGGEILALIESIEVADTKSAAPLQSVRAEIASRQGRVAEALEICFGAGGAQDALSDVESAELLFRSGEVKAASSRLTELLSADEPEARCSAAAVLSGIELRRGAWERAQSLATEAFQRDRAQIADDTRARLHLALAAVEFHAGRMPRPRWAKQSRLLVRSRRLLSRTRFDAAPPWSQRVAVTRSRRRPRSVPWCPAAVSAATKLAHSAPKSTWSLCSRCVARSPLPPSSRRHVVHPPSDAASAAWPPLVRSRAPPSIWQSCASTRRATSLRAWSRMAPPTLRPDFRLPSC